MPASSHFSSRTVTSGRTGALETSSGTSLYDLRTFYNGADNSKRNFSYLCFLSRLLYSVGSSKNDILYFWEKLVYSGGKLPILVGQKNFVGIRTIAGF